MSAGLAGVAALVELLYLPQEQRDAIFALGERELRSGKTAQAIETLQVAAHIDPLNPVRWRRLGEALRAGGRIPEADLYTRYALELSR